MSLDELRQLEKLLEQFLESDGDQPSGCVKETLVFVAGTIGDSE